MTKTVRDIIHECGGATAVSERSGSTDRPVQVDAIHKWYQNGIPGFHWKLVLSFGLHSYADIEQANDAAVKGKSRRVRPLGDDRVAA